MNNMNQGVRLPISSGPTIFDMVELVTIPKPADKIVPKEANR